jgi:hypothetical protein
MLVKNVQEELTSKGSVMLPHFVDPDVLRLMQIEVDTASAAEDRLTACDHVNALLHAKQIPFFLSSVTESNGIATFTRTDTNQQASLQISEEGSFLHWRFYEPSISITLEILGDAPGALLIETGS